MDTRFAVAAAMLAALGAPAAAQESARCFIEVQKLLAAPPAGISDLHGAIGELDAVLRPQVEEITRLKAELERLDRRQRVAMTDEDSDIDLAALDAERGQLNASFEAKQARLKEDYTERQKALVGPVQTRVAERAQAFGTERGCKEIKMARGPDLAALQSDGARDITGDFVAWYEADRS